MYEGRVKPFDTLARNSLRIISGKRRFRLTPPARRQRSAISNWLLDVRLTGDRTLTCEPQRH